MRCHDGNGGGVARFWCEPARWSVGLYSGFLFGSFLRRGGFFVVRLFWRRNYRDLAPFALGFRSRGSAFRSIVEFFIGLLNHGYGLLFLLRSEQLSHRYCRHDSHAILGVSLLRLLVRCGCYRNSFVIGVIRDAPRRSWSIRDGYHHGRRTRWRQSIAIMCIIATVRATTVEAALYRILIAFAILFMVAGKKAELDNKVTFDRHNSETMYSPSLSKMIVGICNRIY